MKKPIALFSLFCTSAFGATLNPIQLLNPAGSTSGQAIISTGPSSAPTWGSSSLAAISGNSLLGNSTGSSAVPSAVAVPSCSATGSALLWTSNTGFGCATGYAPLASPTFTGTVTTAALTSTGAFTPSQTSGIVGTTTNNNANAGSVGEYVTATISSTPLTNGVNANLASISLTAGDWDVTGVAQFVGSTNNMTYAFSGFTTTSAGTPSADQMEQLDGNGSMTMKVHEIPAPTARFSLSATTTVYFVGKAGFSTGTVSVNGGRIRARRVR